MESRVFFFFSPTEPEPANEGFGLRIGGFFVFFYPSSLFYLYISKKHGEIGGRRRGRRDPAD